MMKPLYRTDGVTSSRALRLQRPFSLLKSPRMCCLRSPRCCIEKRSSSGCRESSPVRTELQKLTYRKVMLKISGEALQGHKGFGVEPKVLQSVAAEIATAHSLGAQLAVVVGGGNYWRGADAWSGIDRASADYVGMLATVMNALLLQAALERVGIPTRVQTAIEMREIAEPYVRRRAIRHMEKGRIVIFGGGTGNPFFTTDTAAALRAAEIGADVFLKATKVDGVYNCDPLKNPNAVRHSALTYEDVQRQRLRIMDQTAITLCEENQIPVVVYNMYCAGHLARVLQGDVSVGTTVAANLCSCREASSPVSSLAS